MQFLQHCNGETSKILEDVKRCDSRYKLNAEETISCERNTCLEWANDSQSLTCGHCQSCLLLCEECGTLPRGRDKTQRLDLVRGVIRLDAQL